MSAEDTSRPLSEAGEEAFDSMLAAAAPGEILRTEIALGEYPDGLPMISPAIVARGRAAGPTLWVQACLHGPEVGGILGIHAFLKSLRIADLKGTIVFLLVTNPLGFRANQRLTPQDGANLNRAFPGSPDGGPTQQLADRIFRLAIRHADAMLDLHSGGDHAISAHYSIFTDEGDAPGAASRGMARAIGAPLLWNAPPASLKGAAYLAFCEAGKPAVLFESGGGARVTVTDIRNFANALVGASSNLGILPARAEPEEPLEGREVRTSSQGVATYSSLRRSRT